jgi:hypothetical protein
VPKRSRAACSSVGLRLAVGEAALEGSSAAITPAFCSAADGLGFGGVLPSFMPSRRPCGRGAAWLVEAGAASGSALACV